MSSNLNQARLPDIVIATGTSVSNALKAREIYADAEALIAYGASVTDGAITYNWQVCPNIDAAVPQWFDLFPGGALLVPPAQGQAQVYSEATDRDIMAADAIRIKSSANVTANRNWNLTKQYRA